MATKKKIAVREAEKINTTRRRHYSNLTFCKSFLDKRLRFNMFAYATINELRTFRELTNY